MVVTAVGDRRCLPIRLQGLRLVPGLSRTYSDRVRSATVTELRFPRPAVTFRLLSVACRCIWSLPCWKTGTNNINRYMQLIVAIVPSKTHYNMIQSRFSGCIAESFMEAAMNTVKGMSHAIESTLRCPQRR